MPDEKDKKEYIVMPEKPAKDGYSVSKEDREEAINEIGDAVRKATRGDVVEEKEDKQEIDDSLEEKSLEEDSPEAEVDDGSDKESESEASKDEEYEEIPEYLVTAGRFFGKNDEEIINLAENEPQVLEDMARLVEQKQLGFTQSDATLEDDSTKVKKKEKDVEKFDETSLTLDEELLKEISEDEDLSPAVRKVIKILLDNSERANKNLKTLKSTVDSVGEISQEEQTIQNILTANKVFDMASKKFPELMTTEKLPRYSDGRIVQISAPMLVRNKVFDMATAISDNFNLDFKSAMNEALKWYSGGKDTKTSKETLKEIKDKEKKLSPGKRQSRKVVKKYASEMEEKADVVKEAFKKAGVTPPEY